MTLLNISLICLFLKYVHKNKYKHVIKVCKCNYKHSKIDKSLWKRY